MEHRMATLERAFEIAAAAHDGQTDKAGAPYIAHVLRVALSFIRTGDERRAIIAVLHDTIEDTSVTVETLVEAGFTLEIVEAVCALTRRAGESYADLIARAAANPVARPVKMADVKDHLAPERLAALPEKDADRLRRKYAGALEKLA
jgi:(p)ppGpp synthase/HD superfamily hydrolase